MTVQPVIRVSGIRKSYGRTVAVDEVSFEVAEGEIRVADFRTELPNLEDVFLRLTGHSIRD